MGALMAERIYASKLVKQAVKAFAERKRETALAWYNTAPGTHGGQFLSADLFDEVFIDHLDEIVHWYLAEDAEGAARAVELEDVAAAKRSPGLRYGDAILLAVTKLRKRIEEDPQVVPTYYGALSLVGLPEEDNEVLDRWPWLKFAYVEIPCSHGGAPCYLDMIVFHILEEHVFGERDWTPRQLSEWIAVNEERLSAELRTMASHGWISEAEMQTIDERPDDIEKALAEKLKRAKPCPENLQ